MCISDWSSDVCSSDLLEGGYSRYSQAQVSQLWKRAIELTGDPNFGFKVAAEVRAATFHVLGYSMSCSATLCRALERFAFYCRLISDSDRKSVVLGKGVSVSLDLGGRRTIKKKTTI